MYIEIYAGHRVQPLPSDVQRNIDAIDRAILKADGRDKILLNDTKSILEGIRTAIIEQGFGAKYEHPSF